VLELLEEREPVNLGHFEIGEDNAKTLCAKLVESFLPVDRNRNFVAFVTQNRAETLRDGTVVVSDQNSGVLQLILWNGFYLRKRVII
jgi:hypothetical protein